MNNRICFCLLACFCWALTCLGPSPVLATEHPHLFLEAVTLYEAGDFAQAAKEFEALAEDGIHNGKLYYNIANAHLKDDRLGPAILWYERALRLVPEDPDLRFNLNYARTLLEDEPAALGSPVLQILFFWKDLLGVYIWQWLGIIASVLFWCTWAGSRFIKKIHLKPFVYVLLCLALLSSGTAVYLAYEPVLHPRAVILQKAVPVRSGLSAETTELFVLHEGTLVAVEKQTEGYLKIRYAEDKIGWVPVTKADII
jgi:tetratricopeptide (TPR) repeat protein